MSGSEYRCEYCGTLLDTEMGSLHTANACREYLKGALNATNAVCLQLRLEIAELKVEYCDVCGNEGKDLRTSVEVCRDCYDVAKDPPPGCELKVSP